MDPVGLKVKTVAKIDSEPSTSTNDGSIDVKPHVKQSQTKKRKKNNQNTGGDKEKKAKKIKTDSDIPQVQKTPKKKRNKKLNQESPVTSGRKISDYFQKTAKNHSFLVVKKTLSDSFPSIKRKSTENKENDELEPKAKISRIVIENEGESSNGNLGPEASSSIQHNGSNLTNLATDKTSDKSTKKPENGKENMVADMLNHDEDQSNYVPANIPEAGPQNSVVAEDVQYMEERDNPSKQAVLEGEVTCPKYKVISGTTFAVDAFDFGNINGVTHYFLSHFHARHHMGLSKAFEMPIICSSVTSRLIQKFLKIHSELIKVMDINETIGIDGVKITAIDANHCPGALMFLFKLPNGHTILHTGHFRATPEMEKLPVLINNDINEVYLDTTYYCAQYELMSQSECILQCLDVTRTYLQQHSDAKVLICVGTYVIGKELVWKSLAKEFNFKVCLESKRRMAFNELNDEEGLQYLVDDPKDAGIHVVNKGIVNFTDLKNYLNNFPGHFTHVLGIDPSGWEKNSTVRNQGNISIVGIEYSEHSSYFELQKFLRFIHPSTVISTVPMTKDPNSTPDIPREWYMDAINPPVQESPTKIKEILPVIVTEEDTPLNPSVKIRRQKLNEQTQQCPVLDSMDIIDSQEDGLKDSDTLI